MTAAPELRTFGPYRVVRVSGAGGMARVELALREDGDVSELCVLKRLHAEGATAEQQARFRREAKIAVRLAHDNIARTFRAEEIEGELCLAQELVEGVSLGRLARQSEPRGIPIDVAVHVVREVAAALAYAHELGGLDIVHRDVTPENVMLSWDGDVKLIDFGIARLEGDATLTSFGTIVGRRAYISPEAWTGIKVDARADIYALGVVLWELLTGRRLEELPPEQTQAGVPDPRAIRSQVPPALAAVTMTALAIEPGDRYQKAAELRRALDPFVGPAADPRQQLARVLAQWFNVDQARQLLADDLTAARRSRAAAPKPPRAGPRGRQALLLGSAFAAAAAVVAVVAVSDQRSARRRTAPPAAVAAPHSTPPLAPPARVPSPAETVPAAVAPGAPEPSLAPEATAAQALRRQGRRNPGATAADSTKVALAIDPKAAAADGIDLLKQANQRWDAGKVDEALALARRAIAAGAGAPAHVLAGSIYMNAGNDAAAERELGEAARLNPGDAEARRLLSLIRQTRAEHGEGR